MSIFEQSDVNLSVWLNIDGQEYELSQFNVNFGQNIDVKGESQVRVRGGQLNISIKQSVPGNIYNWAMKSTPKDGTITFKVPSSSAPLSIEFTNAYCVSFNRNADAQGEGLNSSLIISPEEILFNGISFDNRWVK